MTLFFEIVDSLGSIVVIADFVYRVKKHYDEKKKDSSANTKA